MNGGRAAVVGVLVCTLSVTLLAFSGGVAGATETELSTVQEDNETDEDRPLHENPDSASGEGNRDALSAKFVAELQRSLEGSAVQISEGEYEQGRDLVGPEFQERLDQYVEVSGETDTGTAGNQTAADVAETLSIVSSRQQNLSDTLSEYNETLSTYQQGRDRGDAETARTAARTLIQLADRVEQLGQELQRGYDRLAEAGTNVTQERRSITDVVTETTERTERIAAGAFVPTSLTVSAQSEQISYRTPLQLDGQLVDVNGTPISEARIAVPDPAGATTTRTDDQGRFSLSYRPVRRSVETETIPVQYRPAPTAPYQAAEQSVPVDISAVEGTLTIDTEPEAIAYGSQMRTTAKVSIDGQPVSGVPLQLSAGGLRARARTADNGTATFAPTVPATLPAGTRTLRVEMEGANQSVRLPAATTTVTVESTPTALNAEASSSSGGLFVEGTLTSEGQPVPNQSIDIVIGGQLVDTAKTDASGAFTKRVDTPETQGSVTVEVVYDEPTTNLEPASAQLTVDIGTAGAGVRAIGIPGVAGGGILFVLSGLAVAYWRGWRPLQTTPENEPERDDSTDAAEPRTADPDPDVLTAATERLETAPNEATALAYGDTRRALASQVDVADRATHWEFYQTCAADGLTEEQVDALETVTERYEDAVFSPTSVDVDDAREAVTAARRLTAES